MALSRKFAREWLWLFGSALFVALLYLYLTWGTGFRSDVTTSYIVTGFAIAVFIIYGTGLAFRVTIWAIRTLRRPGS